MAELALVGSGKDTYQLWLGGTSNTQRLAKPYIQRMPLKELEKTLEPLLVSWKKNGEALGLGDYVNQIGDKEVLSLLFRDSQDP